MPLNEPSKTNAVRQFLFQRRKCPDEDFEYIYLHIEDDASYIAFYDSKSMFPEKIYCLKNHLDLSLDGIKSIEEELLPSSSPNDEYPWKQVHINFPERWNNQIVESLKRRETIVNY